jgi:hypothetical protein
MIVDFGRVLGISEALEAFKLSDPDFERGCRIVDPAVVCGRRVPIERISHTPASLSNDRFIHTGFVADLSAVFLVDFYASIVANDTLMVD